ncbi:MAG: succinyldiaminopimelate transaminase, partial [Gammaproteobacteria bacterium]
TVDIEIPPAAFYLWLTTPIDDETFARELYAQQNVTALPGSYLARETAQGNPGKNRLRISLVAEVDECRDAMQRVREFWCGL